MKRRILDKNSAILPVLAGIVLAIALAGCGGEESDDVQGETHPAVSRDGRWIAFTGKGGVYVAPLGQGARKITDGGQDRDPEWSPDGSRIVFSRFAEDFGGSQGLYIVNRDGSGLRQLTKRGPSSPSWSPDGKTIAFNNAEDIRLIDLDGKNNRVLLRRASDPAWSPDGTRMAFVPGFYRRPPRPDFGDFSGDVAIFDPRTRRTERVIHAKSARNPAWSADGTRIAFEDWGVVPSPSPYFGAPEIYVVKVDGTGLRRLTRNTETDWSPTWTRDGRIIFASNRDGRDRLYAMDAEGRNVRLLGLEVHDPPR